MGTGYNPAIITDGLVLSMDPIDKKVYSGSGTSVKNRVNNGYDGTLTNGAIVDATAGGSFELDGTNDVVTVASNSYWNTNVLGSATNFSIMCWTKCDYFYNWSSVIQRSPGGNWSDSSGASLWINAGGFYGVYGTGGNSNGSGSYFNMGYSTSNTADWFHLALTGDGTTCTFYVNGKVINTKSFSSITATHIYPSQPVCFGRRSTGNYYNGKISAISMYNKGLTSSQILQNFNAQKSRFGL